MACLTSRVQAPVVAARVSRKTVSVSKRCSVISFAEPPSIIPEDVKMGDAASDGILKDVKGAPTTTKAPKAPWVQPTLNADTPSPIFGGSTGGLLRKAQVEEFYVCTWEAKKEQIFEMPTGGAAIMRKGPNLLKLARKEQALALTSQLKNKFKLEPCFYRVFPDGKVQYLHPADGVYPEKVNAGRQLVNCNMRRIGQNVNPIQTKFTGKGPAQI